MTLSPTPPHQPHPGHAELPVQGEAGSQAEILFLHPASAAAPGPGPSGVSLCSTPEVEGSASRTSRLAAGAGAQVLATPRINTAQDDRQEEEGATAMRLDQELPTRTTSQWEQQ